MCESCSNCNCKTAGDTSTTISIDVKTSHMKLLEEASELTGMTIEEWVLLSGVVEAMNVINKNREV